MKMYCIILFCVFVCVEISSEDFRPGVLQIGVAVSPIFNIMYPKGGGAGIMHPNRHWIGRVGLKERDWLLGTGQLETRLAAK